MSREMLRFGEAPYLECSSKGDRRFSALYARLSGRSIEEIYQSKKIINGKSGWPWYWAKGKKADNQEELKALYARLWDEYFIINPDLLREIKKYKGFSDIFGQEGHVCQAEEIYRIWKNA